MNFTQKIKKWAKDNDVDLLITSSKKWHLFTGVFAHGYDRPKKIIMFRDKFYLEEQLCHFLIQYGKGKKGYSFAQGGDHDCTTYFYEGEDLIRITYRLNAKSGWLISIL